jgi:hypothetical protein
VGKAILTNADCNWDFANRSLVANLAESCREPMTLYDEAGVKHDWNEWTGALARELAARGQREQYEKHHLVSNSVRLDVFARLRGKETAALNAVKAAGYRGEPAPTFAMTQYQIDDILTCTDVSVNLVSMVGRGPCDACGNPFPNNRSICMKCGWARPSYICLNCNLPSPAEAEQCVNSYAHGCSGSKARSRAPEAGEMKLFADRLRAARELMRAESQPTQSGAMATTRLRLPPARGPQVNSTAPSSSHASWSGSWNLDGPVEQQLPLFYGQGSDGHPHMYQAMVPRAGWAAGGGTGGGGHN